MLCALFAAITGVCSYIMIPLPFTHVPLSLSLLSVWVCGSVLGAGKGALSMTVFILLGAIGVPVFGPVGSGFGILIAPLGGYIIGYIPAVMIFGLLFRTFIAEPRANAKQPNGTVRRYALTVAVGLPALAACYAFGTVWFVISSGTGLREALMLCVVPFIPGDILKLIAAAAINKALSKPLCFLDEIK